MRRLGADNLVAVWLCVEQFSTKDVHQLPRLVDVAPQLLIDGGGSKPVAEVLREYQVPHKVALARAVWCVGQHLVEFFILLLSQSQSQNELALDSHVFQDTLV